VRSLRNLLHGLLVSFVAAACIANCSGAPGESASLGAQLEVSSAPIVAPRRPRLRGGPPRASGQPCRVPEDCASLICQPPVRGETVTRCADPSANDGVKNDAETDVDCGGGVQLGTGGAPACPDRESCQVDGDCLSGYCSPTTARCVAGRSCKGLVPAAMIDDEQAGIDTCGVGESTDPPYERAHESCCRSLLLPTATDPAGAPLARVRMDKYEVTSGRMRQFVEGVKASTGSYDLRAWATGEVLAGTKAGRLLAEQMPTTTTATQSSFLTFLPTSNDPRDPLNLPAQLGATSMDANVPSEYQGCYSAPGAFGATDYWQGPEIQKAFWSPPREFPQADYDIKPINCAPYWMYAAFCAWDGGRLPTLAEVVSAWGPDQYPWGSSFIPSPYPYDIVGEGESSHRHARIPAPSERRLADGRPRLDRQRRRPHPVHRRAGPLLPRCDAREVSQLRRERGVAGPRRQHDRGDGDLDVLGVEHLLRLRDVLRPREELAPRLRVSGARLDPAREAWRGSRDQPPEHDPHRRLLGGPRDGRPRQLSVPLGGVVLEASAVAVWKDRVPVRPPGLRLGRRRGLYRVRMAGAGLSTSDRGGTECVTVQLAMILLSRPMVMGPTSVAPTPT